MSAVDELDFPAKLLTGSLEINVSNIVTKIGSLLLSRAEDKRPQGRYPPDSLSRLFFVVLGNNRRKNPENEPVKTSSPWFEQ